MQAQMMETLNAWKTKKVCGVPAPVLVVLSVVVASLTFGLVVLSKKSGGLAPMLGALKAAKGNPMKVLEGMKGAAPKKTKGPPPPSTGPPSSSSSGQVGGDRAGESGSEEREEGDGDEDETPPPKKKATVSSTDALFADLKI